MRALDPFTIFRLAEESPAHPAAVRERLRREIMAVDDVEYQHTTAKLCQRGALIDPNDPIIEAPHKVAIYGALITGWVSIPLLFHYPSASLFNHYLVTAAPPEIGDADTCLEVGMWAWAWMEPSTGALSFFLLCMQFAREQSIAIGGDSFHGRLAEWQGKRLAAAYPEYDYKIVHAYGAIRAHLDDTNDLLREQLEIEALLLKAEPEESPAVPER